MRDGRSRSASRRYWDRFYSQPHRDLETPSSFALLARRFMEPDATVFEIGSGNGRDALYFAAEGLAVHASDPSSAGLEELARRAAGAGLIDRITLIPRPMHELDDRHAGAIDAVYSRFVLHAVTAEEADSGLDWASRNVRIGGHLLIEARSTLGSLYGLGKPAGRDAFIHDGHYRRFIRSDELEAGVASRGFRTISLIEQAGLSPHGSDDPVLIRLVAERR